MPAFTRRQFLERVGSLPALLHFGFTSRAPFSEWKREFFRQSSVGAALEAGQSLPAGIPGDPKSSLTIPPLGERFDLARHFVFEYYLYAYSETLNGAG
jgi:hypothetical protein